MLQRVMIALNKYFVNNLVLYEEIRIEFLSPLCYYSNVALTGDHPRG